MTELELAIEWLKRRSIKSKKLSKKVLLEFNEVIPTNDVISILEMLKEGSFIDFLKIMKEQMHPSEILYFNPEDLK